MPGRLFPKPNRLLALACLALAALPARAGVYECLIEPIQTVEVRSPVEGLISHIHVQRGDRVRRGQLLVQLESAPERSSLELARYRAQMEGRIAAARGRLDYARQKAERQRDLAAKGFISAQALDEAQTELRLAESEYREATENRELAVREEARALALLRQRQLRSPLNGVVMDRLLNPGDLAESGTGRKPILSLAQLDPLRVEAVLPISAYGQIRRGMQGQVRAEGFGRHMAAVKVVDPVLDAASGTFRVRLEMRGGEGSPPGGLRCQVELPAAGPAKPVVRAPLRPEVQPAPKSASRAVASKPAAPKPAIAVRPVARKPAAKPQAVAPAPQPAAPAQAANPAQPAPVDTAAPAGAEPPQSAPVAAEPVTAGPVTAPPPIATQP